MPRTHLPTFPSIAKQLAELGERLRAARLRRRLTTVLFAERVGVSRDTLSRLEKGDPAIAIGSYLKALRVLGLDADIDLVARDDVAGRQLQDRALPARRARRAGSAPPAAPDADLRTRTRATLDRLLGAGPDKPRDGEG